ncbi:hypothetical protein [Streptomyces rapamycinicus]|uniref:Uncharacterized protein n=2 Tax=Streptomyces rapamycinicus TaxID=1226757 RepID=A0A0A0NFM0_STRRN|nr:hypothetical protein [Streptomyces rapamycinicus]AGP55789.1 hypothetical protein M271_21230 [Streptomyces rapamycinicus NRRL 5491]MBB4783359.1 hypothetical protein [Streptomyces rapamycinicus]RLV81166.1 hypothetical protein D3C57_122315 [Streptomyces rapamycinicus NRRL 5491]UTO63762.1 hypothetical protein LJB45_16465 [Streptomyces rapamycinicus]UTP31716.1 hypothetical protein LIV37_21575 [Streptomyces rapamycinicus NRRL 5491]
MNTMTGLRLLPWSDQEGRPCYLTSDRDESPLNRRADQIEALQLSMGTELLGHARALLEDHKADARELRFLADRLCEALRDALRVAESRGRRLPVHNEDGDQDAPTGG